MKNKIGIFSLPAVLILFILVFINDTWRLAGTHVFMLPDRLREGFIGIALLAVLWSAAVGKREEQKDLFRQLRRWASGVVILFAAMLVFKESLPFVPDLKQIVRFNKMVSYTIIFFTTAVIFFRLLSVLKTLVFIQQKKSTQRNFRIFFLLAGLYLLVVFLSGTANSDAGVWPAGSVLEHLSLSGVLLFAFLNGRRTHWIHYLNKKQKVKTLLWGLAITPFSVFLMMRLPNVLAQYSEVAGAFAVCMVWANLIGSGMVLLDILFHMPSAGLLDKRMKEIQSLQSLSAVMSSVFEHEKLLAKIVELSLQVVGADAVWLELKLKKSFELAASKPIEKKEILLIPDSVRQTIRYKVLSQSQPLLINDLQHDSQVRGISQWTKKAGSLLAVKIRCQKDCAGVLYAMKEEPFGFEEESGGLFQSFADQAAISLENSRLVRLSIEQERYREELRLAHEAQRRLLPQKMPEVPGVDLDGFSLTANDIGGDFYDAFLVHPDRLDIVVGDVSGNGALAAFYMAELHGSIQTLAFHFSSPKEILLEINAFLKRHNDPENFVTILYAIYQPSRRRIRFVRAGHQPAGYLSKKGFRWIEPNGLGLGLVSSDKLNKTLEEKSMVLNSGDALFFYTDGLIEVKDGQGKEFDEAALAETLVDLKGEKAKDMLAAILRRVHQFSRGQPRTDDMTAVVLRVKEIKT